MTAALAAAVLVVFPLTAEDAPWSYGTAPASGEIHAPASMATDLYDRLVSAYRGNKETTSIHRCLFAVSCSHFAERAIERYGVVAGSVVFIDRYFYRENVNSWEFYPKTKENDGDYNLDDGFFVP